MEAPELTCVLQVNTEAKGWQKTLSKIFQDIHGLKFSIDVKTDVQTGLPIALMFLQGQIDPVIFIKKLYKARSYAALYRLVYGFEKNPQETRRPNSHHFTRCRFKINVLEITWFKQMTRALPTIQGVSFTIDGPTNIGFISGNVETGVLMKMIVKAGLKMLTIDYGVVEDKDSPPKKPEVASPQKIWTLRV